MHSYSNPKFERDPSDEFDRLLRGRGRGWGDEKWWKVCRSVGFVVESLVGPAGPSQAPSSCGALKTFNTHRQTDNTDLGDFTSHLVASSRDLLLSSPPSLEREKFSIPTHFSTPENPHRKALLSLKLCPLGHLALSHSLPIQNSLANHRTNVFNCLSLSNQT